MKNIYKQESKFLKQKREQLISSLLKGKEPDFLYKNAGLLDDYFCKSFEKSIIGPKMNFSKNPYALIALGGYGRKEQCIYSDVDLLLLFSKKIPDEAEELVREIIYPLWDIGLEVGYATRSLNESISLSRKDFEVLTSLLDARFICGMSQLYSEITTLLGKKIVSGRSGEIIRWLVQRNEDRHLRFGDSTYLLEPNLKEGQGGLRDYHTMLWIARIKSDLKRPRDLEYNGYLSYADFKTLTKALSFIWNVRNRLHHLTGRKCDQLNFEYQIKLADALGFKKENGQEPVEKFLGELHGRMEFIKEHNLIFLAELGSPKKLTLKNKRTKINGLEIIKDMLNITSSEQVLHSPELLIKIFEESARLKIPLSAEAKRVIKEFSYLVDDNFRSCASCVKTFERILAAPPSPFNVLNEMLNTGFLTKFIPEIEQIVNRIQYDEYHLYPVDKHSLRTVQAVKKFGEPEKTGEDQLCHDLYKELSNRKPLLWAALLHDIGKGDSGGGHSKKGAVIVRSILSRAGLRPADIETVSFLVLEHLLLIKTATRRDVNEEETAVFCARRIKDPERLKMLYLLTVADSISTGPKAWNDWTSTLLRELFFKVLSILEKGELATTEAVEAVEEKKNKILSSTLTPQDRDDIKACLNLMSPRYLLYTSADDILEHIRLYKLLSNADFVWEVAKDSESNTRTVTICAKDCPGLSSKIAGVFTLNNIDIIGAQVYTWRNNIALDIFNVKPPLDQIFEDEKWARAKENLHSALSGDLDLKEALREKIPVYRSDRPYTLERPHRVEVDNKTSSFFTIIEVFTYDFPGLLFNITDALFRCGLDVWIAKISTKVDQVVDVFYVRDFDGQKVDSPGNVKAIKTAIEEVLPKPVDT